MTRWSERSATSRAVIVSGGLALVLAAVTSGGGDEPTPTTVLEALGTTTAAPITTTLIIEASTSTSTSTTTATTTPTTTMTTAPTTTTTLPEGSFEDGVWLVGADIEPGRYRSVETSGCYWERLSGLTGAFDDILANGNGTGGPLIVDIEDSDEAFGSSRCGLWVPYEPAGVAVTGFGEGDWAVGGIAPGVYSVEDVSGCYWQRLAGFSGGFDDILANGNVDGRATVEILPGDAGFSSSRCGTWEAVDRGVVQTEATSFGDGVHLVGVHVAPGRYRIEGVSGCYWARLSGVSGGFSDILANDNVDGTATVEIRSSDVAFESSRCGEWVPSG